MVIEPTLFENKIFSDPRGLLVDLSAQESIFNFNTKHQCFSLSEPKNTLRGLHFQSGEYAQSKIVSCVTGSLIDVVVNIDRSGNDFGKVFYFSLNGLDGNSVYVPKNCAHGFITTSPNTVVHYSFDSIFWASSSVTLSFFDPALDVKFPVDRSEMLISSNDQSGLELIAAAEKFETRK
jgi:dTDP-4-dehydrorhamnose 3,5-epimerase